MKLPTTFLPEHKSLDEKTEQLLEEPKILKEEKGNDEKEKLVEGLIHQLKSDRYIRHTGLQERIEGALEKDGYLELTNSNSEVRYWAKNINSSETRLFVRRGDYNYIFSLTEYGFASLKPEKLEKFCARFDRYEKEIRNRKIKFSLYGHKYNHSNYKTGGLATVAAYWALMYTLSPKIFEPSSYSSIWHVVLQFLALSLTTMYAYPIGGQFYEWAAHKLNKKKMLKLCSDFVEDEEMAIRRALV